MSRQGGSSRRGLPPTAAGVPAPADKRFRRSEVRQGRRRSGRTWLRRGAWWGAGALTALALAAWIGSAMADAAALRVDHLDVRGNRQVTLADVEARLDGIRGESVLRVNLEQYRARLLESPWVASAELWRVLPSSVQVRIVERVPLAVARSRGQLFLVDDTGVRIDTFGPQYRQYDLPIVDGLVPAAATDGAVDPMRIRLVQRLFTEVSARDDLFQRISQVDVTDARNAVVLLDGEPASLQLGDREFLSRLERYLEIEPQLRDKPPVEYYKLQFGDRVWVK